MDILETTRLYIKEMVTIAGPQMKILLMDKETTSIVSCAYAQSEMMQREVFLFERLDGPATREPMRHLKCIVFLRPTPDNIHLLAAELRNPKYAQYYIFFANIVSKTDVKTLAEADEHETVREVHEFFIDSIPLARQLASLNMPLIYASNFALKVPAFRRIKDALIALLLTFKKKPFIRYQRSNKDVEQLAQEMGQAIRSQDELFEDSRSDCLLLIIDRSLDPVTPLLNQWTYEAMVHELLTINNNRVTIDGNSIVLSTLHDEFYDSNVGSNFGEIGQNIKVLMNDFQKKSQIHKNLESIADMKSFVEEYPQFKKISGTVSKHVSVVGELSRLVAQRNLLEVSELEQTMVMAGEGERGSCAQRVAALLQHSATTNLDALRLVMLYALRFESSGEWSDGLRRLVEVLRRRAPNAPSLLRTLLQYAHPNRRGNDLFGQGGSAFDLTKRFIKGLKGVENVYTQHEPYLATLVDSLLRGRLSDSAFPSVAVENGAGRRLDTVIVFVVGGATFEESVWVRTQNAKRVTSPQLPTFLLASTHMHNTASFVEQLADMSNTTNA